LDLEASEFYIRTAMLAMGAGVLERLLHDVGVGRQAQPRLCGRLHPPCKMESTGVRDKTIHTILGPVRLRRSRLRCPLCGAVEYPADEWLRVAGTGFSPGLRRLMTRAGSDESFDEAAEDLRVYAALQTHPKDIERVAEATGRLIDDWMRTESSAALLGIDLAREGTEPIPILYTMLDGTGAPVRKSELRGVKGKNGQAKTREVKLGCVFTQTALDEEGNPVRDPLSTTYVGAIEASADFGHRLVQEAVRRGLKRAQKVVVLSDGAEYNHAIAREHFPQATHIIDFYHASERLNQFIKENTAHPAQGALHRQSYALLEDGCIEELIDVMRHALPRTGVRRKAGLKQIAYYADRAEQMRYAQFKAQGLFVGSGVIEAGCKTLIGKRLKQPGMFWSVQGANAIIAARCCLYSGRFEQFWESAAS
jgi:hypothetical protein